MTIPADYAQVNFRYSGAQYPQGAEWTMGIAIASYAGTPGDLAGEMVTAWDNRFQGVTCDQATLLEVLVKFGPDATGPSATVGAAIAGSVSDPPSPAGVAILVQRRTAFGGRKGRGRIYLPGIWDGGVGAGGVMPSGTVGAIQVACNGFLTDIDALDCVPVLLHGDATVPYPITSLGVQSTVATQRRRQRR